MVSDLEKADKFGVVDESMEQDEKLKRIVAGNPMIYMHLNGF